MPLLAAAVLAAVVGCLMVSSAASGDPRFAELPPKQIVFVCLGFALALSFMWLDYQWLARCSRWLYLANIGLLGLVLLVGRSIGGSQRWINLRVFHLQPSEFAKILLVVTMAALLHSSREARSRSAVILRSLVHLAIPLLLIAAQPDLGTGLVLLATWLGMLWIWGISPRQLLTILLGGALLAGAAWHLDFIRDYQKTRLSAFVDPQQDPDGAGYQIIQSQIAIGAGGLWGAGLHNGTQNRLAFIPTQTTDFIFTIAGEEFGFVGSAGLVVLYFLIVWRALTIATETEDPLGALMAVGVVSFMGFQAFVNIGMTMRLCPVSGMPLPFVSYGGSSMLTCFLGIGLLQSVSMRRRVIQF